MSEWERLNKTFKPITGASKTKLCKKFAKVELYDSTRYPDEWITELELLRKYLQTLGVIIDDVEIMTHILSFLSFGPASKDPKLTHYGVV